MYWIQAHRLIQLSLSLSLTHRVHGGQALPGRPGQHAAGAGAGHVQPEVRRGAGHQVPGASALQADQEQPGLGAHRGPPAGHPLPQALHLRLAKPGADPGRGRQDLLHHHQVRLVALKGRLGVSVNTLRCRVGG